MVSEKGRSSANPGCSAVHISPKVSIRDRLILSNVLEKFFHYFCMANVIYVAGYYPVDKPCNIEFYNSIKFVLVVQDFPNVQFKAAAKRLFWWGRLSTYFFGEAGQYKYLSWRSRNIQVFILEGQDYQNICYDGAGQSKYLFCRSSTIPHVFQPVHCRW